MGLDRRDFLRMSALGAGAMAAPGLLTSCTSPPAYAPTSTFAQGVASGFHSDTEVVLWTRVEPLVAPSVNSCDWQVSTSPSMSPVVASGTEVVEAASDHTVKVLVGGLEPGRSYWYRFEAGGVRSTVGRASTLPEPDAELESLRLAYASCQCYGTGYYPAWRDVAARDLDGVVFLGDFIYEAGAIQLLRPVRSEPVAECVTIEDYRTKYRLYRSDPDIQAAQAAHPWAVVWDDHELHNDWNRTDITLNPVRFAAATQAWFEHQPVMPVDGTRIFRSLRFGRLAELHLLDERQYRDPPVDTLLGVTFLTPELARSDRTILGAEQLSWLLGGLAASNDAGVRHQLLGNPVLIGAVRLLDLDTPELRALDPSLLRHAGLYLNSDAWDGFPAERERLISHLVSERIGGVTILTGDIHSFWAGPIRADFEDSSSPAVAYEYAGGAIASPPGDQQSALAASLQPAWDLVDASRNGYGIVECTPEDVTVSFLGVDARYRGSPVTQFATFPRPI
ncbi:MAG: alkaline phosphatase D family protein [Microthrixaceae bacterium]|nr:alkaline phosphatase D family protein [Microthrixaceae bacterium]